MVRSMSRKILVMGGSGYIGSNVASFLMGKGEYVGIYDLVEGNVGCVFHQGDILHDAHLAEVLSQYDIIIYLICTVNPKKSMDHPNQYYDLDVPMLLKVLDACRETGCKRVIFSSSGGTVYGEGLNRELREDADCYPVNHYAIGKLLSEKILLMYNDLYGMENVILRISNPYGKGQKVNSGVGAVTIFTNKLLNGEPITLYSDPETVRDYVSITAILGAFYQAVYYEDRKDIVPVFNIGSGVGISLSELISLLSESLGISADVQVIENRGFDIKCNILNVDKARTYLGYDVSEDEREEIKKYALSLKEEYLKEGK